MDNNIRRGIIEFKADVSKIDRTIEVFETEKACIIRNVNNVCDRNCAKCDLILPDSEIIGAYDAAIKFLRLMKGEKT